MPRIIAGKARGHRLRALPGLNTRPTPDRVREALFSSLRAHIDWPQCRVLDLFSGSGALGLEALSEGADYCVMVEKNRAAAQILQQNAQSLLGAGIDAADWRVMRMDVDRAITRLDADIQSAQTQPFALVFIDPPYAQKAYQSVLARLHTTAILAPDALLLVEYPQESKPVFLKTWAVLKEQQWGRVCFSWLRKA